jgi:glycosyltransferase involved in cell wall biosynthesis
MSNELVGIAILALVCILLTPYFKDSLNVYVEQPNRVFLKQEYAKTTYPKKIVLHSRTFLPATYAGSEISAYETIKYLRNRGHSISIMVNEYKYTEFDGFPIYEIDMDDKYNIVKECDVIFFQSTDKNKMLELAKKYNKPCYVFIHMINDWSWLIQQKMTFPVTVVYNSEYTASQNPTLYKHFKMIPYVDTDKFNPLRNYTSGNTLVCLINCNPNKGGDLLVRLAKKMPNVQFLGIKGAYSKQLDTDKESLDNLLYIENQKDITVVFKRIGILIMPSHHETWGRTAVEAMASGVPIIHSNAEGLVECVGGAGIQCDRDDEDAWINAINRLQGDRAYKEQMRQRGFKRVKEIEILQDQGRQELARRIENQKLY